MGNKLLIFIDESGDPGKSLGVGASSSYYAELALQIHTDGLDDFLSHLLNWKYCQGRFREAKGLPSGSGSTRYVNPLKELYAQGKLCCSCVYLTKEKYDGPYLGTKPIFFRNFVHRQLLEFHFGQFPAPAQHEIDLIFDQYNMNLEDSRNLEDYLLGNLNLPTFKHICHIDSVYVEAMQTTSQLVNAIGDIILGTANDQRRELLDFIKLKDITIQRR